MTDLPASPADPAQNLTNIFNTAATAADTIRRGISAIGEDLNNLPNAQRVGTVSVLSYPSNAEGKYKMAFQMSEYYRPSIFNAPQIRLNAQITLPIAANLIDTQRVTYAEEQLGALIGSAAEGASSGAVAAAGAVGALVGGSTRVAGLVGGTQAIPALLQQAGLAANPFLTVMFKSPQFKRHQFSWRLSPNDPSETEAVKQIIDRFRWASLPRALSSVGGALLTYPNVVNIKFIPNEEYMYVFKPCVIESVSVSYAPSNVPSFFGRTQAPVELDLSLSLLEIEYWVQNHFNPAQRAGNSTRADIQGFGRDP